MPISKKFIVGLLILVISLLNLSVEISAKTELKSAVNTKSGQSLFVPSRAVEVAPHVFSLGESIDHEHGDIVQGYMFVHPKKGYGKPENKPGKGGSAGTTCYGFLAKDAKWKTIEPWVLNPSNTFGISDASVLQTMSESIAKWEDAAQADILGNGLNTTSTLVADTVSMDGINEVYFDSLDEGTIGVTIVWGIFGGSPQNRELREWDQVYNTFYNWGDAELNADLMDLESIATHELGHSVGMNDLYDQACSDETMYGYGTEGETKKRDLGTGDIAGINKLY